jgi:hypothetical protein
MAGKGTMERAIDRVARQGRARRHRDVVSLPAVAAAFASPKSITLTVSSGLSTSIRHLLRYQPDSGKENRKRNEPLVPAPSRRGF